MESLKDLRTVQFTRLGKVADELDQEAVLVLGPDNQPLGVLLPVQAYENLRGFTESVVNNPDFLSGLFDRKHRSVTLEEAFPGKGVEEA